MKYIFCLLLIIFSSGCSLVSDSGVDVAKPDSVAAYQSLMEEYNLCAGGCLSPANKLVESECTLENSNVYKTECVIELLDNKAAEREWKQSKLETVVYPQINTNEIWWDWNEYKMNLKNWRLNFEKTRDGLCETKYAFIVGSGIPYSIASCKLDIELEAVQVLNTVHSHNIVEGVYGSVGISDFEPSAEDIERLVTSNATKRGCVWAGEEDCEEGSINSK